MALGSPPQNAAVRATIREMEYLREVHTLTLQSYCLVCRDWRAHFTPALYTEIIVNPDRMATVLRRTLWHFHPDRKKLVRRVQISYKYSSGAWTLLFTQFPNLKIITIYEIPFDRIMKRVSERCETTI